MAIGHSVDWIKLGGGVSARQSYAELLLLDGQWAKAEEILAALMREGAQSPGDLFVQLSNAKDFRRALQTGVRLFADDAESKEYLARLAVHAKDWAVAEQAVADSLVADKNRVRLYFIRAHLLSLKNQDTKAALPVLKSYLDAGCPGGNTGCSEEILIFAYRRFVNGLAARNLGDWDAPLKTPALWREQAALSAAEFFEINQMPDKATPLYKRVAKKFFYARLGLARLARDSGDLAAALKIIDKSSVADGGEFILREITAADIMEKMGDKDAALKRIVNAHKTTPDNARLIYFHALLAESAGHIDQAIALLRRMTKLYPQDPNAWNALGYVMADHNIALEEAEGYIKKALSIRKDDPNILDSLGWVYYRLGRLASARHYLNKAAEGESSAEIFAHLGEVLWELGNHEEAKKIWRKALAQFPQNTVLDETVSRYRPFE